MPRASSSWKVSSESLRLELIQHKIYVSVIVPGAVATDTLDTSIREVRERPRVYEVRRRAIVRQMPEEGRRAA